MKKDLWQRTSKDTQENHQAPKTKLHREKNLKRLLLTWDRFFFFKKIIIIKVGEGAIKPKVNPTSDPLCDYEIRPF